MKRLFLFFYLSVVSIVAFAAEQFVIFTPAGNHFPLIANGVPCPIYVDSSEDKGAVRTYEQRTTIRYQVSEISAFYPDCW